MTVVSTTPSGILPVFVTLAGVKSFMRVGASADFDANLQLFINAASQDIASHAGRQFVYGNYVETVPTADTLEASYDLHGAGNESGLLYKTRPQRYILRAYPVDTAQPISVAYDPTLAFTDPSTAVDPTQYDVNGDPEANMLTLLSSTRRHPSALRIDYWAGYHPDPSTGVLQNVDPRIVLACYIQVAFLFNKLSPDNIGMDSDRTRGTANRQSMVQKFNSKSGLTPEAAGQLSFLKNIAMGRH